MVQVLADGDAVRVLGAQAGFEDFEGAAEEWLSVGEAIGGLEEHGEVVEVYGDVRMLSLTSPWFSKQLLAVVDDNLRMPRNPDQHVVLVERVQRTILILRGHRVILDADLAALYGVETKRLNEQVRRNAGRFPKDFAFQLTLEELDNLKSQIATSSGQWGGRRKLPYAFTEHGALMAASVLNSPKAVEMSILVVRAFVRLRRILAGNRQWAAKLDELERRVAAHDKNIVALFQAVRSLMAVPEKPTRRIGFAKGGA
jgi:hypothetical protein